MEKVKRVTKKESFERIEAILVAQGENELAEAVRHEIELLSKRKNGETKAQKENVELAEKLFNKLVEMDRPATATEVFNEIREEDEAFTSNQKVSALLKKLVDAGRVTKVSDKKKSYFSVATDAE